MQKFIITCLTLAAATMLSIGFFYSSASASDSSLIEMQKSTKYKDNFETYCRYG